MATPVTLPDHPDLHQRLFEAARAGDEAALTKLLDEHPDKLTARTPPYQWTLLHTAAQQGRLGVVDLLLRRGVDANVREEGDNTTPMFWAAAAGQLEVVRRLIDAGGDATAGGDDHELEVIGWASCWDGCDDAAHRAVVDLLVSRGARHHIFSAIAMRLPDEVRRIVARDPSQLNRRMSRNENHQLPLHFAVRMNRPEMVALLIELGADALGVDADGQPAAAYATAPRTDRPIMEKVRAMTSSELDSARRGHRAANTMPLDLLSALSLGDFAAADRLMRERPAIAAGALHLMAKRNDVGAMKWLLAHGADPSVRWAHWDAEVTPLHLAVLGSHTEAVRLLLEAGADPTIKDSKHDGDALAWADFFGRTDIGRMLRGHKSTPSG